MQKNKTYLFYNKKIKKNQLFKKKKLKLIYTPLYKNKIDFNLF